MDEVRGAGGGVQREEECREKGEKVEKMKAKEEKEQRR